MCTSGTTRKALFRGALVAVAAGFMVARAHAAPPDITKYCQTYIHPGVPTSYSPYVGGATPQFCIKNSATPRADGWAGARALVDLALACKLTNGSEYFHYIDGGKIDCGRAPRPYVPNGPDVHILQPADLDKYCAHWHGPGARAEYSPALKRAVCNGAKPPGPSAVTINFVAACVLIFKARKVRYVDGGKEDYVACVK